MGNPDKIDALFSAYSDDNPGASVMVIHKGKVILNNNYGLANIAQHIPVTEMSNFRLASITKQFTAMAILQLMDEKLLDFNTKMIEIFPEFPDYANAIDYGQLLHHTSGLVDYEELMADTLSVPLLDADVLHLLLTQDSTYFEPGSNYSYSNGGYAILALTVERLAGLSFPEYLEKHIFIPLGMHASLAYKRADPDFSNRAFGYYVNQGDVLLSDQSMTSSVLGDGGVYSSTSDMYKWDQALYGTSLLSQALMDSAFTPWKEDYGCGWRIEDYRGLKRISHTGSTSGFRNVFQRFPEQEFSVIILTNRRDPGVQYLAEAITDIYLLD
ncbi:beta-lactamase family protein [bacterium]|nr:beta-lactamase family protein [bacterium]